MASYKLTYFALRGRAKVSRLLFTFTGQEYEDVQISPADWPSYKPKFPFHQAPVLEVTQDDGKTTVIAQSGAIERFLDNKLNLLGHDDLERARIDMINEQVADILNHLRSFYYLIWQKSSQY
jgi:glutathione S-transferase